MWNRYGAASPKDITSDNTIIDERRKAQELQAEQNCAGQDATKK